MKKKSISVNNFVVIVVLSVLSVSLFRLYYCFITDSTPSDFPAHIDTVVSGQPGYSLMHKLMWVCYLLPHSELVLSLVMCFLILATCFCIYRYMYIRIGAMYSGYILWLFSIALLFTSNICIPRVFGHLYSHFTTVSQPWHNSTYILMRFFAIWVISLYFAIYEKYTCKDGFFKESIWFTIVLSFCNYAKPNFFLAFAPSSCIVFAYLLIRSKGRRISDLFKWGLCYILSMPCMILMYKIVYEVEETDSSLMLSLDGLVEFLFENSDGGMLKHGQVILYIVCNLLFPLFVVCVFLYKRVAMSRVIHAFLFYIVAHIEKLLLVESGDRMSSGNYSWGVYCMGIILFMVCITEWLRAYKMEQIQNIWLLRVGLGLFFSHIICGIGYYTLIHMGVKYII